jgi:hypothetical protein
MKLHGVVAAICISLPAVALAQPQPAYTGDVTFTKTANPSVYDVKGALDSPSGPAAFDVKGTLANGVVTYTFQAKVKSIVAAISGQAATMETLTYTFTPPAGTDVAGTYSLSAPAGSSDPVYTRKAAPAPGEDPSVARAAAITTAEANQDSAAIQARFGVRPKRWYGYLTPPSVGNEVAAAVNAASSATGGRVPPAWLYTIAMGEGLNLYLEGGPPSKQGAFSLDGFYYLGTDTFSTRAAALAKEGYLPKNFTLGKDYVTVAHTNEHGDTVQSASFKDLTTGLTALASMVAESRDRVLADAKKIWPGVTLTEDDIRFWTYLDFNVGSGARRTFMEKHDVSWGRSRPGPERDDQREGRYNSIVRVATARWIEDLGLFPATAAPTKAPATPAAAPTAPAGVTNTPLGE